jgi:hypothetical protein
MRDLIRLFIFACWVTLCIWAWVQYEYKKAHTIVLDPIVVTPKSGESDGRSRTN